MQFGLMVFFLPAFTNKQQLNEIGLDTLVEQRLYNLKLTYKEWRADFDWFARIYHGNSDLSLSETEYDEKNKCWKATLSYIRQISERYGPFDGIAGFCEGASVASAALHLQGLFNIGNKTGLDLGLSSVRFFIAISPWRTPYFEHEKIFNHETPLNIPSLHIFGQKDMDMFKKAVPIFMKDFSSPLKYEHNGKHEYPIVTQSLKNVVLEFLKKV